MRQTLRWLAAGIGGAIVMTLVAVVLFFALGGASRLKPLVEDLASVALGRAVTLTGFDAEPGWQLTRLRFEGIAIANSDWAGDAPLAELRELSVSLRPKTLLWGPLELPSVEASGGAVRLLRNAEGEANWAPIEEAGEVAAPETRSGAPEIGQLVVSDVSLSYEDREAGIAKQGRLASLEGTANEADGVAFALEGETDGQSLTASFSGGGFRSLVEGEAPYPVELTLAYNGIELAADGSIDEPAAFEGVALRLEVSGANFADLYPLVPAALPATPPFSIEGDLVRRGDAVSLSDFAGRMGDSDVAGSLTYNTAGERPLLSGRIVSERLDFDDLAPLIGAAPNPEETASREQVAEAQEPGLFPDEPIPVERFRAADLDIELEAPQVVDATIPVTGLTAHFRLQDARLEVRPLELTLQGGGTAGGELAVNAREATPSADLALTLKDVSLKPWFRNSRFVEEMGGLFGGKLYLLGVGASLAEIAGSARGKGVVTYREGTVSGLLVEAAGLDVVEALALVVGDDTPVAVRCGGAGFHADQGKVRILQAFVDTSDSLLVAAGGLDLTQQSLDLRIEAEPKDFSLIDMAAPVRVSGAIEDPDFEIADLDPLPFFELGEQDNIDCAAAYEQLAAAVRGKS